MTQVSTPDEIPDANADKRYAADHRGDERYGDPRPECCVQGVFLRVWIGLSPADDMRAVVNPADYGVLETPAPKASALGFVLDPSMKTNKASHSESLAHG